MLLEVTNLTKFFDGLSAVRDLSFKVEEGEIVGLIGPNGAGKTTVFSLLSGYYKPTSGKVSFKGHNITGIRPSKICKLGLTRTFQIVQPFPTMSVLENIMVGVFCKIPDLRSARARAEEILQVTEMLPIRDRMAESLTLKQWKMLEIAKALGTNPSLLLLDEVLAGLNATETTEALKLIRKVREYGITILMVEHVMQAIMALSDRVIVLQYGEKIAEGTPDEVTKDEAVIKAYLGNDFMTM